MRRLIHVIGTTAIMIAILTGLVIFVLGQLHECEELVVNFGTGNSSTICVYEDNSFCLVDDTDCKKGDHYMYCDLIGTRSEGWYSEDYGLVKWDNCANLTSPLDSEYLVNAE